MMAKENSSHPNKQVKKGAKNVQTSSCHKIAISTKRKSFNPQALIAIALQLVVVIFIIISLVVTIYIREPGSMSTEDHLLYVTGITVLATLLSTFTAGQIRHLWFTKYSLINVKSGQYQKREEKAKVVVGLASFRNSWGPDNLPISVTLAIAGLITTSIVAALTPTVMTVNDCPQGAIRTDSTKGEASPCFTYGANQSDSGFEWKLLDGTTIGINTTSDPFCPLQNIQSTLLQTYLNAFTEVNYYPYSISGVSVSKYALGAPYGIGLLSSFDLPFGNQKISLGSNNNAEFQWVTQCFPTVVLNPVQCEKTGIVTANKNILTVNARNCSISSNLYGVNLQTEGGSVLGACTSGQNVGSATLVIGSVNKHAMYLALAMYDSDFNSSQEDYAVACSINIAPTVSFRVQNYTRTGGSLSLGSLGTEYGGASPFAIYGSSANCTPGFDLSQVLTNTALVTGAAASYQLLSERQFVDGWWPTLWYTALNMGGNNLESGWNPDLTFNNSRCPLEEALGVASAIALGYFWGSGSAQRYLINESVNLVSTKGQSAVNGLRLGPGRWWAIVYILPSAWSIFALIWLVRSTK